MPAIKPTTAQFSPPINRSLAVVEFKTILPHPLGVPRPLGNLNAAMRDLDMDADGIRRLIDEGVLIAFDIARQKSKPQHLRILTKSIDYYRQNSGKKFMVLEWPEIFRLVLPHEKLFVRGLEMQRSLNCDEGHVANLIKSGFFTLAKKARAGRDGSPIVTRASFENFLIGRLL
jgi:hypothetical protein